MTQLPATIPASFSLNERDRRWALARQIMVNNNLETLIVYGNRPPQLPFVSITILMRASI